MTKVTEKTIGSAQSRQTQRLAYEDPSLPSSLQVLDLLVIKEKKPSEGLQVLPVLLSGYGDRLRGQHLVS